MGEQASQKMSAQWREDALLARREGVGARGPLAQRLMQMPAARHHVLEFWTRHECSVIAVSAADLFCGGPEQDNGVGRRGSTLPLEREVSTARAKLDFDGAQRQTERDDLTA